MALLQASLALFGGLVLLIFAADWLVDGAVAVASKLGVPTMVVGLTIVAYGTSFPEFVVSVLASQRGVVDFAIGNIVGSNIANIGLVLGSVAIVAPFAVHSRLLFKRDLPILGVATAFSIIAFLDGQVVLWEGLVLIAMALGFTVACLKYPEDDEDEELEGGDDVRWSKAVMMLLLGIGGLLVGANFMVDGGSAIAKQFGISERVIGLTIVAVGTSLPELAASVASAAKGHPGLAVGNVVGSCLFNLAFVLGAAACFKNLSVVPGSMVVDLTVMVGLTMAMWLTLRTGRKLTRPEGVGLVVLYVAFLAWVVVDTLGKMGKA